MKLLLSCSTFILCSLTVITKLVLAQAGPDIEERNGNELRVRALLNTSGAGSDREISTERVILDLPSNGDLVYKEIGGQNINQGSRVVWYGDQMPQNAHATCFLWRQSDEGIPWQPNLNFVSAPIYPMGEGIPFSFPRADRLYCFDSTADKAFHEDVGSTADGRQSYALTGAKRRERERRERERKERERSDNSVGTFTLLFEYRHGRQALIRLRSPPGLLTAFLDLSDVNAAFASTTSDNIEPGINVVRVALIDTPRTASDDFFGGVKADLYEKEPRCLLSLSQTSRHAVRVGRGVTFNPYLNIFGISCHRASMWSTFLYS